MKEFVKKKAVIVMDKCRTAKLHDHVLYGAGDL